MPAQRAVAMPQRFAASLPAAFDNAVISCYPYAHKSAPVTVRAGKLGGRGHESGASRYRRFVGSRCARCWRSPRVQAAIGRSRSARSRRSPRPIPRPAPTSTSTIPRSFSPTTTRSTPGEATDARLERRVQRQQARSHGLVFRDRGRFPVRSGPDRLGQRRAAVVPARQRAAERRQAQDHRPPGDRERVQLHVGPHQHARPLRVPLRPHRGQHQAAARARASGRRSGCWRRTAPTADGRPAARSTSSKP